MRRALCLISFWLAIGIGYAVESTQTPEAFVRQIVQSLIDGGDKITFDVADTLFAIDNGETLTKAQLREVWPKLSEQAFKEKKVALNRFFKEVELRIGSPLENKRLMSNERVLKAYKHQEGDLCFDLSHVKTGVENFIGYDKAFIYIIRKIEGKWTLIGIGG